MSSLLVCEDLGVQLDDDWIFKKISFDLKTNEILALEGPSGSGKSTLLKTLIGLNAFNEGRIRILDRDFDQWKKPELRKKIFFLHQESPLYSNTVLDQLELPFKFSAHQNQRLDSKEARRLFSLFGKDEKFLGNFVKNLSGGEKQICSLVRALLLEPQVLLLDEPSSSMDEDIELVFEKILLEWIENSAKDYPRGVLLTSHNSQQLDRVAHRRIQMERSK